MGRGLASAIGKAAKIGAVAAGVATGAALISGFRSAIDQQNQKKVLGGLYGNTKLAEDTIKGLAKVSRDSPLDFSSYQTAAANLAYAGVQGKDAIGILKNVGLAITAAGGDSSNLQGSTDAILKMVNAGKVQLDTLQQLSNTGVPILSGLAKHYGTSIEHVNKMASAGQIKLDDVLSVMQHGTGDTFKSMIAAGESASKSFSNQWKIAKDNVTRTIGTALLPVIDKITPAMGKVAAAVPGMVAKVESGIKSSVKVLSSAWDSVRSRWESTFGADSGSVWDLFHSGITMNAADRKEFASTLADDKWMRYGATVRSGMEKAVGAAKSGWSAMTAKAKQVSPKVRGFLTDAFGLPPEAAKSWSGFGSSVLGKAASAAKEFGQQAWDGIGKFLNAARPGFEKLWDAVQPIITEFGPRIRDVLTAFNPFTAAFRVLQPILPKVAELVGGLASSIGTLLAGAMRGIRPIFEAISGLIQRLIPYVTQLVASLMPALAGLVAKLKPLFEALAPVLEGVGKAIATMIAVAEPILKVLLTVVRNVIGGAIKVLGGLIDFLTGIFTGDWKKVWSGVKQIFTGIWNAIKGFLTPLWNGIKKVAQAAWDAIKGVILSPLKAVRSWLTGTFSTIKGWFSDLWGAIKSVAKTVWGAFYAIYISPLEKAYGYLTGTFGKIKGWFSSLWGGIKSGAKSIWGGIQLLITRPLGKAYTWVKDTFGKIKGWFTDLWNGIVDKMKGILGGVKGIATDAFSGIAGIIKKPINGIISMINNTAIAGINKLIDGANKVPFVNIPHLGRIPSLAEGGIVKAPTLALVGDAGRGNPEIVAPERMIRRIIREEVRARHGVDERRPVSSPVFNITEARANPSEIAAEVNRRLAFVGA